MMNESKSLCKKSRLAVFEQITPDQKRQANNKSETDEVSKDTQLGTADNEDEYDDDSQPAVKRKCAKKVHMVEEPLQLICCWNNCGIDYDNYRDYVLHITQQVWDEESETNTKVFSCQWENCSHTTETVYALLQHVCYHGYHTMLKNIGNNVLERIKLPPCNQEIEFKMPSCPPVYSCEWKSCDKNSFLIIFDFFEHVKMHIDNIPRTGKKEDLFSCNWLGCSCRFTARQKLIDHLRTHTKQKVIACPTCGYMFATKTKFCDHRKRQLPLDLQSYQCSQCSKLFATERLLRDHMRSHINHYKCTMCDMTCQKPSILAKHIRYRHLNERPFKCHLCKHACVTKGNLEAHLLSHCSEKFLVCEECDFKCRSPSALDRHYQIAHGTGYVPLYECHCCQKKFSRGSDLTKHLMKMHNYHWPSGHSRFRYKEDPDGIFRLQTVRYESIEVTQEMMSTSNTQATNDSPFFADVKYKLLKEPETSDKIPSFSIQVAENEEENICATTGNKLMIMINDVDEYGNTIHSEVMESDEIIYSPDSV